MEVIVNPALRATVLYITLLILARIMGKKIYSKKYNLVNKATINAQC